MGSQQQGKQPCPHCGAAIESEEHMLLRCPRHKDPRQKLLRDIGWPRDTTQLDEYDAVLWMVPDATHAACSEEKMATSVQEFCHAIALTRASRKTAAKVRREEQGLTGAVSPNERRDDDMSNDDEESGKSK